MEIKRLTWMIASLHYMLPKYPETTASKASKIVMISLTNPLTLTVAIWVQL